MIGIPVAASTGGRRKLVTEPACRTERCKIEFLNKVGRSNRSQNSSLILNSMTPDRLMIGNSNRSKVRRDRHTAHCHRSNRLSKNHCCGGDDVRRKILRQRFLHRGVHDARVSDDHDAEQNRPPAMQKWPPARSPPGGFGEHNWN